MTAGTALKVPPLHESLEQLHEPTMPQQDQPQGEQPEEDQRQPLHECVRSAMRYYLQDMDGHDVEGLYRMVLNEVERPLIETVLESANNNQSVAARMLGMSRGTLRKKLQSFKPTQSKLP